MRYVRAHTVPYSESFLDGYLHLQKKKKADSSTNMQCCQRTSMLLLYKNCHFKIARLYKQKWEKTHFTLKLMVTQFFS